MQINQWHQHLQDNQQPYLLTQATNAHSNVDHSLGSSCGKRWNAAWKSLEVLRMMVKKRRITFWTYVRPIWSVNVLLEATTKWRNRCWMYCDRSDNKCVPPSTERDNLYVNRSRFNWRGWSCSDTWSNAVAKEKGAMAKNKQKQKQVNPRSKSCCSIFLGKGGSLASNNC